MELVEIKQVLDFVSKLYDEKQQALLKALEDKKPINQPNKSSEIKELATALAKAQSEMNIAGLTAINPYFKNRYADFAQVVKASRPALTKHGLSVSQQILQNEDGTVLQTVLLHSSGQFLESRIRIIPPKNDIQSLGSYITYLKRYSYASLIGVVTGDEDDDGEVAMEESRHINEKGTQLNTKYNAKEQVPEPIVKEQLEELEYELSNYPDIAEMILNGLQIRSLADMPKSKFQAAINRVRAIKNAREGK